MSDDETEVPDETRREWLRFLATKPTTAEQTDWLMVKAAEIGWSLFDLSLALTYMAKPTEDEPGPIN